jgi:hypothetical protein
MIKGDEAKLEMIEGRETLARFVRALKTALYVPKSTVPNPFGKKSTKKRKRAALQS